MLVVSNVQKQVTYFHHGERTCVARRVVLTGTKQQALSPFLKFSRQGTLVGRVVMRPLRQHQATARSTLHVDTELQWGN